MTVGASAQSAPPLPAAAGDAAQPVTFTEHVAPIVFARCTPCHRAGEAAPFALASYRDLRKRASMALRLVEERKMPPWPPQPSPTPGFAELEGSRRLSDAEIRALASWVHGGMPEGDPAKLPPPPVFPSGWHLGTPDLVVSMREAFEIPADGPDLYRNFIVPLPVASDAWVSAVELRPSAPSVVHHALFFLDTTGQARRANGRDGKPGFSGMVFPRSGSLGGWAVGATPRRLPKGIALALPKGADLVLSIHFHPSGKVEQETSTLGIHFSHSRPERTMVMFQVPPLFGRFAGIDIPPGDADFRVRGAFRLPVDVEIITVGAHAHALGKELRAKALGANGREVALLGIHDWDMRWQGRYQYTSPVRIDAQSTLEVEIAYDNSAANPRNPHRPPRRVRWGLESLDEMGSVFFGVVCGREADIPVLRRAIAAELLDAVRRAAGFSGARWTMLARRLDLDASGSIEPAEVPRSPRLERLVEVLDANQNGTVEREEIDALEEGRDP